MAHFAKIGLNSKVLQVIVINDNILKDSNGNITEQLGIEYLTNLYGWSEWKQTSYNTRLGKHYKQINNTYVLHEDQSKAFRKNFACIGMIYNETINGFIDKQPYSSWILNEDAGQWQPPVAYPDDDNRYTWNETTTTWDLNEQHN